MPATIPQTAGDAKIKLADSSDPLYLSGQPSYNGFRSFHYSPFRMKDHIYLPVDKVVDYISLQGGKQFLVTLSSSGTPESLVHCYFGGTDERPFLVELEPEIVSAYESGGEEDFYSALIPPVILRASRAWDNPIVRQGDIFAVRIPEDCLKINFIRKQIQEEFAQMRGACQEIIGLSKLPGVLEMAIENLLTREEELCRLLDKNNLDIEKAPWGSSVLGTRHIISIPARELNIIYSIFNSGHRDIMVGQGTLTAPDHKPRELDDWHLLAQTVGLIDPIKAD